MKREVENPGLWLGLMFSLAFLVSALSFIFGLWITRREYKMAAIIIFFFFSLATEGGILTLDTSGEEIKARPVTIFLFLIAVALLLVLAILNYREIYR